MTFISLSVILLCLLHMRTGICKASGDTSATCVSNCDGLENGNYRSCQSKSSYVVCIDGTLYDMPCPQGTEWSDAGKSCKVEEVCTAEFKDYKVHRCGSDVLKKNSDYYELSSAPGSVWSRDLFCQAQSQTVVDSPTYKLEVKIWNQTPAGLGHPGVMFNAQDENSYDFVYFRPHSPGGCYQTGVLENGNLTILESKSCPNGPPAVRTWFDITVIVKQGEAEVYLDDSLVTTMKTRLPAEGRAGVIVANGYSNTIHFKDFKLEIMK